MSSNVRLTPEVKGGRKHAHTDIQHILITMCGSTGSGSRATGYRLRATCLSFRLQTHKHTHKHSGEYLLSCKMPHWFSVMRVVYLSRRLRL